MQSVTSNAVAQALGGGYKKIKIVNVEKSRTIFQGSQYGWVMIGDFPTDFDSSQVIGATVSSNGVADAFGLQVTYAGGANGTHYFWYYIPNHISFDYSGRTIVFQIAYLSNT